MTAIRSKGRYTTTDEITLAIDRYVNGYNGHLAQVGKKEAKIKEYQLWMAQNPNQVVKVTELYKAHFKAIHDIRDEIEKHEAGMKYCTSRLHSLREKLAEMQTQPMNFIDGSVQK